MIDHGARPGRAEQLGERLPLLLRERPPPAPPSSLPPPFSLPPSPSPPPPTALPPPLHASEEHTPPQRHRKPAASATPSPFASEPPRRNSARYRTAPPGNSQVLEPRGSSHSRRLSVLPLAGPSRERTGPRSADGSRPQVTSPPSGTPPAETTSTSDRSRPPEQTIVAPVSTTRREERSARPGSWSVWKSRTPTIANPRSPSSAAEWCAGTRLPRSGTRSWAVTRATVPTGRRTRVHDVSQACRRHAEGGPPRHVHLPEGIPLSGAVSGPGRAAPDYR